MGIILNIDTALEIAYVGIAIDGVVKSVAQSDSKNRHAEFLHPAIIDVINEAGLTIEQIDAIAVTLGPGSYTGLRVGFSAAKGLSYALNKPLIGIGTLNAMYICMKEMYEGYDYYWPMIDARRMEVFTALYAADGKEVVAPSPVILEDDVFSQYLDKKKILCAGNGSQKLDNVMKSYEVDIVPHINYFNALCKNSELSYNCHIFLNIAYSEPLYTKGFRGN